jgi:hypothetical protein
MSNRRVRVLICSTGERIDLDGAVASLQLVAHEPTIAGIAYGEIEVNLTGSSARLYRRDRLPRKPLGFPQEDSDVA